MFLSHTNSPLSQSAIYLSHSHEGCCSPSRSSGHRARFTGRTGLYRCCLGDTHHLGMRQDSNYGMPCMAVVIKCSSSARCLHRQNNTWLSKWSWLRLAWTKYSYVLTRKHSAFGCSAVCAPCCLARSSATVKGAWAPPRCDCLLCWRPQAKGNEKCMNMRCSDLFGLSL